VLHSENYLNCWWGRKGRVIGQLATPGRVATVKVKLKVMSCPCRNAVVNFAACFLRIVRSRRLLAATQTKHQVESRLLLDVVIRKSPAVLELLTSEDQALLVWGDTLLVLNLRLDVVDGVG
jgi:hypothetical protein